MDYKEKYEQALERASGFKTAECRDVAEYIFPELKESEDEKIRKGIIRNLEFLMDRAEGFVKDELKERIAWLEKQGERKYNWNEEDEKMLVNLIDYFKIDDALQYTEKQVIDWLKSLKQRLKKETV